jgi:Undecaprenyl-phosphate glucose phosphotransferase
VRRQTQDALLVIRILSDLLMVTIAWIISYFIRFSGVFPTPRGVPEIELYAKLIPFIWIIWFATCSLGGLYRRTGGHRSAFIEGLDILQSCVAATLAFIAFTYVYEEYRYSRAAMAIFAFLHPWLIIGGRSIIRKSLRRYRRLAPGRRTLIIGGGENLRQAIELAQLGDLTRNEISGVILAGDENQREIAKKLCLESGLDIFPIPQDWTAFFSQYATASVVCALPHQAYDFLSTHLETIANQVPDIKMIPDLSRFTRFASGVDIVAGTPIISINESPLNGLASVVKRIIDVIGSLLAIIIFGPIMATVALLVAGTSRGPILYRQERMGLDGKTFYMLKFRSMRVDAEAKTGAVWAKATDDRTTPIGKWLRRTSLDELPQFFNVLRGDMSLVGPRPERPVFVEQFRRQIPGYYLRHKTKAGITGWAQVKGWRGNTSLEKRIECDLYYIQNWSVWLDFKILFLTVFRGFIHKNAY